MILSKASAINGFKLIFRLNVFGRLEEAKIEKARDFLI